MAIRWGNLFSFLEKKVDDAEMTAIVDKVMAETAFKRLAFYISVSYIAGAISMCEIKVYENGAESKDEMYYKLNFDPNQNENAGQFWHKVVERIYYKGDALVYPHKNHFYCADSFYKEDRPMGEDIFSNVVLGQKQLTKNFRAGDVFYFRLENEEVRRIVDGMCDLYGQVMGAAISAYKNSNGKKYKLNLDSIKAGDADFNEKYEKVVKKQLQAFIENNNAVFPQFKGYDLQDMAKDGKGMKDVGDITGIKKDMFDTVAQAIKIPISMLAGNITNMDEIVKEFLTFAVDPVTAMMSAELTRKTGTFETWTKGRRMKVDTSKIKHVDLIEIGNYVDKLIGSGFACVDEVREAAGLDPLNNDFGRTHFVTKNYDTADEALKRKGGKKE